MSLSRGINDGTPRSYYALRVCPDAAASPWWASARDAGSTAPPAIRAILAGRSRVELTAAEAENVLAWARTLPGWDDDSLAPLRIYPARSTGS